MSRRHKNILGLTLGAGVATVVALAWLIWSSDLDLARTPAPEPLLQPR